MLNFEETLNQRKDKCKIWSRKRKVSDSHKNGRLHVKNGVRSRT